MTSHPSLADAVYAAVPEGLVTEETANAVVSRFPDAVRSVAGWIRDAAAMRDWHRVDRLVNLATPLGAPGLSAVLQEVLEAGGGPVQEDLVDALGEIRAVEAAGLIYRVVRRSLVSDAPAYRLSQKAILALADLETNEARGYLREMTTDTWPDVIRWNAAGALCIEDELGFDEDAVPG